jgi:pyruvate dehydrogenase E2 component (dihydrolipoamide acetyltransferase)
VRGEPRTEEPTRQQRTVARRAAESRATVPHLELSVEADMTACLALMQAGSCSRTALLVKACALALCDVPRANAAYRDGRFELYPRPNVGVSLPTQEAFAIATVPDADRKPLSELSEEIEGLATRAWAGQLTPPELSGATFTLTDLGAEGVGSGGPLVVAPHAAALAAGSIREVPVVRGEDVVAGHRTTLTLACDHRILYGREAARFLTSISSWLEQPEAS